MSTMKAKVEIDETRAALEQLGLLHAALALPDLMSEAVKDDLPVHRFLDRLLASEVTQRDERRIKTSLRLSGLFCSLECTGHPFRSRGAHSADYPIDNFHTARSSGSTSDEPIG